MSKNVNKSQVVSMVSAQENKQTLMKFQLENEPAQFIVAKNVKLSFLRNVGDDNSEYDEESGEKKLLVEEIRKLMFGWSFNEAAQRVGVGVDVIHGIHSGKIKKFSCKYLKEILLKFEEPEYPKLLLHVRDHLDFLYGNCGIVGSLRAFGSTDSEIMAFLLDSCDGEKEKINEQTVGLLGSFELADMLVRFVDDKHFEKMQRVFSDRFLSPDVMIFFNELSKIPLIERIEAKERETSRTNSRNASYPRLKGILDAEKLFDGWNKNVSKYANQSAFVAMLLKKKLCLDDATARTWLKKFVLKAKEENRLNPDLMKKLPQKNKSD